jgi:histidine ammonia-lyase
MPPHILLDRPLSWRQVADIAEGVPLALSDDAQARIRSARRLVESIVSKGVRAYGVNTGVGALCDVVVTQSKQEQLSRNILMSHAVGVGPPLVLGAKEGLSLVNGTPCATGLSAVALGRVLRLLDWADTAAAMTFENLRGPGGG